jgi:hypothetical protein
MNSQLPGARSVLGRPPGKSAFGQSFLTQPETLAVIHQHLDGIGSLVSKNEHITGKRLFSKNLPADLS